ncbi:MAG: hypothetical protein ACI9WU_000027 [Myxococcota bacterium]|jgi:hypothetical protein
MADARTAVGGGYAAVCLALGVAGILMERPQPLPRPDFRTEGWRPSASQLAPAIAQNKRLAAEHPWDEARDGAALQAFYALGEAEVLARSSTDDTHYLRATEAATRSLNDYWFAHGKEGYLALGVHVTDRFVRAVHAVLTLADRERMPVLQWLERNPEPASALYRLAGDFVRHAVEWGLILPNNRVAGGSDLLLRIHFEVRWSRFVTELMDYTQLMHPEELRALWKWRLEGDLALGPTQRRKVASWLKQLEPDYPIYEALTAVFAQRGRYREAIPLAREALLDAPFDSRLRQNLAYLLLAQREIKQLGPPQ